MPVTTLSDKTRLKFKKNELDGLSDDTIVRFRIINAGTPTDPRNINITIQISVSEIFTLFDREGTSYQNNLVYSWPRFPDIAREYIVEGTLDA